MRSLITILLVALSCSTAFAGLKCARLPRIVFWSETADVHDDGTWHRTKGGKEKEGHLDEKAFSQLHSLAIATTREDKATRDPKVVACLDALIANPKSAASTKACALPKRESNTL